MPHIFDANAIVTVRTVCPKWVVDQCGRLNEIPLDELSDALEWVEGKIRHSDF